jgi:Uma2 family endonuclease
MSTVVLAKPITIEELQAAPKPAKNQKLSIPEPRDKPQPIRNFQHASCEAMLSHYLVSWLMTQPQPRGRVLTGDVGVRLPTDRDTTFGVDVLVIDAELNAKLGRSSSIVEGVPVLAVEFLSPSNRVDEMAEKRRAMLAAGVSLVWIIDPDDKTVLVYSPNEKPRLFNDEQVLTAEPYLPGFQVEVSKLFE